MLLTEYSDWVKLYDELKAETRKSSEKHVNIYVSSADVDAVCTLRILETMLQNDLIPHSWTAVSRYEEVIQDFLSTYDENDDVLRYVMFINCGASEDVGELLRLVDRPSVVVIVIDSHRPVMHLANTQTRDSQVFVLMDAEGEGINLSDIPSADYDLDDGESDLDDGADEEDPQHASDDDSDRENDVGNNNDGINGASIRRRVDESGGAARGESRALSPGAQRRARRRSRKARDEARAAYYAQGVYYGKPSSCVMYDLAYHLQQDSSYLLWLGLLGLTDHFVHGRITENKYDEYYLRYEGHVMAAGHLEAPRPVEGVDGEGGVGTAAPTCRIVPQDDFRFGLVREWTLWNAMAHSPYVAARLQTYTEKGRERLEFLMAKLGIPLREARTSFQLDMKPQYRKQLVEQLALHGMAYNLGDAIFRSFQLQDGYNRCVMAVDVVHAATALLESGAARRGRDENTLDGPSDHRDRFWRCWNALSWRNDDGELRRGLDLAKKVQRALVADGGGVVVQRLYHNFRAFRIFDLSEHKLTHYALLARPMALQRMASFLQDQHLHQSQNNRRKPVVLIGPRDPLNSKCLVVGFQVSAPSPGSGNRLGAAFEAAAEEVGAQAWHDLFDTAIMEIAGDDVERFKAELLRVATELL